MATTDKAPDKDNSPSTLLVAILFWLGVGLFNSGVVDAMRDRFFVQPVLDKAFDWESRGGEEIALPLLLDLVGDYPRNPKLLWALGDLYSKMDRPVLAHLYFYALSRVPQREGDLRAGWQDFMADVESSPTGATQEVPREVEEQQTAYMDYESQYHTGVIAYPPSINAVLNQPASSVGVLAGYIPPEHPVPCGSDKPRCGYAFQFSSGNLWTAIRTQKATIASTRGGPDCCSVSLDDPDLRRLPVAEEEFVTAPDLMDGRLSTATQDGQRLRLALRSRILTKQRFVMRFTEEADTAVTAESWGIWIWVLLIGWIIASYFIADLLTGLYRRIRGRPARG